jgi:hypothetical protein
LSGRFLSAPELFPARISGERWGPRRVILELGGQTYVVDGLSDTQSSGLRTRYASRVRQLAPPDAMTIHIFRAPPSDFVAFDERGWEYSLDLEWTPSGVSIAGLRLMARADFSRLQAGIWTCVEEPEEFSAILENVLRPVLAARLLDVGGLVVHSAAVGGWLFPSRSGGGKSTISRMALRAGLPVLSDDLNAVGSDRVLQPLPFTGDLVDAELSRIPAPLAAIVALEKGDHESVRDMALADAVALLVRCSPYVNQDPERLPLLLDRAAELASGTRRAILTFRRDADVWSVLKSLAS